MKKKSLCILGLSTYCCLSSALALPMYDVAVANDGSADFSSISEAIKHAPATEEPYVIYIQNGTYHEKIHIKRPNLYLIGEDREKTVITAITANSMLKPNGKKYGTFGSRTVAVDAENFKARSLTIENGFDYLANSAKSKEDPTRERGSQAVALLISHHGKNAQFKDIKLSSYQDTLYLRAGNSYFDDAYIEGSVDFIFGHGVALIDNSEILSRYRKVIDGEPMGYITAPSTSIDQPFGIVFRDSNLSKEPGVTSNSYGLGRPWHPTTKFHDGRYADPDAIGHVAYLNCNLGDHIYGWDKMSGKDINREKIWFYPEDARFWEYNSSGNGAVVKGDAKRPELTKLQMKEYTTENILGFTPDISLGENSKLKGQIIHAQMQFPAKVTLKDSFGQIRETMSDEKGNYGIKIDGLTAPLLVSANDQSGASCLKRDHKQSNCASALIVEPVNNGITAGNVNAFSDLMVSAMAVDAGLKGPESLMLPGKLPVFSKSAWLKSIANFNEGVAETVERLGVKQTQPWDPVSYPVIYQPVIKELASLVIHKRGYDTKSGFASATELTDLTFRPVIGLSNNPVYTLRDTELTQARRSTVAAKRRIFIVGDSTASNYHRDAFPRMGWGQALDSQISDGANIQVVNAARSGRSSRDFINAGWLSAIQPYVQAGDYLLIQFGHNDEKCNSAKKQRGAIDVANLCTYPNNSAGEPQYPVKQPEYSFQHSLERYIEFARNHNLKPVLITPVPRAKNDKGKPGTPIRLRQHVTKQNKHKGYAYSGSYLQTVKDTATKNGVPLIDLELLVRNAANLLPQGQWREWWVSVDPSEYPYYKDRTGSSNKPDTTHFQANGANMVSQLVVDALEGQEVL